MDPIQIPDIASFLATTTTQVSTVTTWLLPIGGLLVGVVVAGLVLMKLRGVAVSAARNALGARRGGGRRRRR